ncbi:MAG: MauE/DoxX family redox-associated membrane protein [Myxococcota bacterium]
MALTVDPALALVLRAGLALLFASAAAHKLRDFGAFRDALEGYRLVPAPALGVFAGGLIAAELGTAAALVLGEHGGVAAAALLGLYSAAIALNLARGLREIDCGCFGPALRQPLSLALVLRNLLLIALAGVCLLPVGMRALAPLDALTIAAGVALGALLHGAVNGLIANAPRLRALRNA